MALKPEHILEKTAIGIMGVDPYGIVKYANPLAQKLLNSELIPGSPLDAAVPAIAETVTTCMEKGKNKYRFNHRTDIGDIEITVSLIRNETVLEGSVCSIRKAEKTEIANLSTADIEALNLQLEADLDHSYYGIYILDNKGTVLRVNDVAASIIGINKKDILGLNICELERQGIIDKPLTPSVIKSKKPLTRLLYVKKSNKYLMASGIPILDQNGNILFVVVIEHDMTIVKELRRQLEQAKEVAETIKSELSERNLLECRDNEIIADAPAMKQVLATLLKLAKLDASNILITGESGTGKGYLAKFIHTNGSRKNKPFISINCAALPEMLLEAELFGYEKGAFTGASDQGKAGLFELANRGTVFLDEIGDLPFPVQAKLLKCLDDGEIRRLGGTEAIKVDCIIIAATNHNLEELVSKKKFRQDLFFRLNTFPIKIPPLRERREDIYRISRHYLNRYNENYKQKKRFSEQCIEELQTYDFPGNVRELKNLINNAVVIKENDLLTSILPIGEKRICPVNSSPPKTKDDNEQSGFTEEILEFERQKLKQVLPKFASTRDLADHLGISQSTVVRKLKKHGLTLA